MNRHKHVRFDWAVKKILRSKANFGILEGFLSELLNEDIEVLELLESEGNKDTQDAKNNRVDLMVKDSNQQLIIIEIQNTRELDYFYKILFNTSRAHTEHMKEGDSYSDAKKIITVSVVYFDLGQGEDYVYRGDTTFMGVHRKDTLSLSEAQKKMFNKETVSEIFPLHYIIKVNSFDDIARDTLDEWIYFFKNSEIKDEFKARGLEEAREKLKEINLPDDELPAYRRYLDQLRDDASIAKTIRYENQFAREKGVEEGLEQGRKIRDKEIAGAMLQKGMGTDLVSQLTGLTEEEIKEL